MAGDVDGDGRPDWVVGEPRDSTLGRSTGRAVVRSGADGHIVYEWTGDSAGDRFGWSVAAAGDVDGDGHADVIVGSPLDDVRGNASGCAFVFSGRDGRQLLVLQGVTARGQLGYSVAAAGDVDGDGFGDVAVGDRWGTVTVYSGRTGQALLTSWSRLPTTTTLPSRSSDASASHAST